MPRARTMSVGVLNIKTHPHSEEMYVKLFDQIYARQLVTKIRGSDWGMIGSLGRLVSDAPEMGLVGTVFRFLNLDPHEPWLDTATRKSISPEDGGTPVIPDNLKPHLRTANFVFFPKGHRLFYDANELSTGSALRIFARLFEDREVRNEFGFVDVHVEASEEGIQAILSLRHKRFIEIVITRPNPDDLGSEEARVMERLERQNVRTLKEKLKAADDRGVKPDEDTVTLMRVAKSNGSVESVGETPEGKRQRRSTKSHPLIETDHFDINQQSKMEKLLEMAKRMLNTIIRK